MVQFFTFFAATPSVYYVFENSDNVGKAIVILLGLMSILTWSVMLEKAIGLYQAKKSSERFLRQFRSNTRNVTNQALISEAKNNSNPVSEVYICGVEKLLEFYETDNARLSFATGSSRRPTLLSEAQYNAIEAVTEREVSGQVLELENKIGTLATMVSVCPFLGLFGTVWGVMLAFAGIAIAGKPDFAALAPGVAGALLTTVAGLVVAIPSLIGYNTLTGTIRKLTIYMDNFTEELMVKVQLEQLNMEKELSQIELNEKKEREIKEYNQREKEQKERLERELKDKQEKEQREHLERELKEKQEREQRERFERELKEKQERERFERELKEKQEKEEREFNNNQFNQNNYSQNGFSPNSHNQNNFIQDEERFSE